jgi:cell division septal protein FtsQ
MWNIKTKVIPVITGASGTISQIIQKIPEQHAWKARNQELQKTVVLGTAHILQKVLM